MLKKIINNYIRTMKEVITVREVVDQLVAQHPQYRAEEVRAALELALNPPDTAEGYGRHAGELKRYLAARVD